ncbi:MAG: PspC domain-containing protein [Oscillospiraceae bacterium]
MKKLYKIEDGKMIAGVCGGLAEYMNVDPTLVRLGTVVVACVSFGVGLIAYIVGAVIMPPKSSVM